MDEGPPEEVSQGRADDRRQAPGWRRLHLRDGPPEPRRLPESLGRGLSN